MWVCQRERERERPGGQYGGVLVVRWTIVPSTPSWCQCGLEGPWVADVYFTVLFLSVVLRSLFYMYYYYDSSFVVWLFADISLLAVLSASYYFNVLLILFWHFPQFVSVCEVLALAWAVVVAVSAPGAPTPLWACVCVYVRICSSLWVDSFYLF